MDESRLQLSVVVCTYNRAEQLQRALDALAQQSRPHDGSWEVVVVDNNCTDHTQQVVESFTDALPGLRSVPEPRQGLTEARQRGFWSTTAPWVAFVDDDCLPGPDWVDEAIRFIDAGHEAAAFNGVNDLELQIDEPLPWIDPRMFAAQNHDTDVPKTVAMLHGAGLVLDRQAVVRSGWLDQPRAEDRRGASLVSGGDNELAIRAAAAGGDLWYVPQMKMRHVVTSDRLKFGYLCRLNYRLAEANPALTAMRFEGASWNRALARSTAYQLARSFGLKPDRLRMSESGVRGRVLALVRGAGYLQGAAKLSARPRAAQNQIIGLATSDRVEAMHRGKPALEASAVAQEDGAPPPLSIVIPTYNRCEILKETLETFVSERQTIPFEVIVCSDGSTDNTVSMIESLRSVLPVRLIEQDNGGAASARNHGAKHARANVILFLDDDMRARPGLVQAHIDAHVANPSLGVAVGRMAFDESAPPTILASYVRKWSDDFHSQLMTNGVTSGFDVLSGHLSIRRELFEELGGFGEDYTKGGRYGNEDLDFGLRLFEQGANIIYLPDACTEQFYAVKGRARFQQTFDLAITDSLLAQETPEGALLAEQRLDSTGSIDFGPLDSASQKWPHLTYRATASLRYLTARAIDAEIRHPVVHWLFGINQGLAYRAGLAGHAQSVSE